MSSSSNADDFNSSSSIRDFQQTTGNMLDRAVNPTCQDVQDSTEGSAFRKAAMLMVGGPRWMRRWYDGMQNPMTLHSTALDDIDSLIYTFRNPKSPKF